MTTTDQASESTIRTRVVWALLVLVVLLQIPWPLASGDMRKAISVAVVIAFFAATASHAWLAQGRAWTLKYLAVTLAFGLGIEILGTGTGFPFSEYSYTNALQPQLAGVPVVIPLAWAMMAYPAMWVAARLTSRRPTRVLVGALALAAWDLFLDPQMVGEGYWTWASTEPSLTGVPGIPLANYAGWVLACLALMAMLAPLEGPTIVPGIQVPDVAYAWTWVGGIIANAFYLGRPAVAVWGGLAMGAFAIPAVASALRTRSAS